MLQLNQGDAILRAAINGGGIAMLSRSLLVDILLQAH